MNEVALCNTGKKNNGHDSLGDKGNIFGTSTIGNIEKLLVAIWLISQKYQMLSNKLQRESVKKERRKNALIQTLFENRCKM